MGNFSDTTKKKLFPRWDSNPRLLGYFVREVPASNTTWGNIFSCPKNCQFFLLCALLPLKDLKIENLHAMILCQGHHTTIHSMIWVVNVKQHIWQLLVNEQAKETTKHNQPTLNLCLVTLNESCITDGGLHPEALFDKQ